MNAPNAQYAPSRLQVRELQQDANSFGVVVQRLCIVEARYAPEIASQMLMKQQAMATVAARKEIVAGALNVVRDTLQVRVLQLPIQYPSRPCCTAIVLVRSPNSSKPFTVSSSRLCFFMLDPSNNQLIAGVRRPERRGQGEADHQHDDHADQPQPSDARGAHLHLIAARGNFVITVLPAFPDEQRRNHIV